MLRRQKAFTLIELLVVISIIALLIGILLPALSAARRTANQMKNTTNLRSVHQGMAFYADSNNDWFPGLMATSAPLATAYAATTTSWGYSAATTNTSLAIAAMGLLLNGNYFSTNILISPAENNSLISTAVQSSVAANNELTTQNWTTAAKSFTSYAFLRVYDAYGATGYTGTNNTGRRAEWKKTLTSQAILMGDRNIGATANFGSNELATATTLGASVWSNTSWRGSVVWGDNHAEFLSDRLANITTKYLNNTNSPAAGATAGDDLFDPAAPANYSDTAANAATSNCALMDVWTGG